MVTAWASQVVSSKESAASLQDTGDSGSTPESERSPGGGNGNPLQYFCLENSMDRGTWQATVRWGCKESDTTERLTHTYVCIGKNRKCIQYYPWFQANAKGLET